MRQGRKVGFLAVGVVTAALVLAATGCATVIDGTPTTRASTTTVPNAHLPVVGGMHGEFDTTAVNALSDIEAFWRTAYPAVAHGAKLPKLKGGYYSVDGNEVLRTNSVTGAAGKEGCIKQHASFIVDNAAYCFTDDSVIWDRATAHLVSVLGQRYGSLLVALVFAHEFGHAIQAPSRLDIDADRSLPTIAVESQADCAAGAFIGAALDGKAAHFRPTSADVDKALDGFLLFRDTTPTSPADISHGNGFDRLSAFDNGLRRGVRYCYSPDYFNVTTFTERRYVSDSDYASGGNEPLSLILDPAPSKTDGTGGGGLQPDLNRFFGDAAKQYGGNWTDVKITEAAHPKCGSASPTSEFGYCPDDNTVYYSQRFATAAYYSLTDKQVDPQTGAATLLDHQPADFALGTLFAISWGLAARHQLDAGDVTSADALLEAICDTGAYAKDVNLASGDADHPFVLSPPDMDEATSAVLNLVQLDQAYGARGTTGLQRVRSFVKGYAGGLSACSPR